MPAETPLPGEITRILHRWKTGDQEALASLASLAYPELRAIASGYLRSERAGHTLQATGLVNELYLRLAQVKHIEFAAQMMRLILIDYARQYRALKRPDSAARVPLHEEMAWVNACGEEMLALDTALDQLEAIDERKVRAIELRFFLGCTNDEAAELLSVSRATIDRDLEFGKTWLYQRLSKRPNSSV
jgi:RNA polymerase sigma factor (TIGR02999 family)